MSHMVDHINFISILIQLTEKESLGKWKDSRIVRAATESHPTQHKVRATVQDPQPLQLSNT